MTALPTSCIATTQPATPASGNIRAPIKLPNGMMSASRRRISSVVGVGSFDNSGATEILFRDNAGGDIGYYQLNSDGTVQSWHHIGWSSTGYSVVGIGDFSRDGINYIVFRNSSTGDTGFYRLNLDGTFQAWRQDIGTISTADSVVAVGDYNGDWVPDLLFRNNGTGDTLIYQMGSPTAAQGFEGNIIKSSAAYTVHS